IILPILTLLVELISKFCAETLLNPIPTYNHAFLIALVPLFNFLVFNKFSDDKIDAISQNSLLMIFSGITISISLYYSLLFLPFSLVAIFAIVFMGLGFLPLSPFLSFISSLICTYTLIKKSNKSTSSNLIKISFGALIGFSVIFLIELQCLVTNYAMIILDRHDHERKIEGLDLLRKYGSLEKIKRSYYTYDPETSDIIMNVLGYPKPYYVDISKIYYFLTGEFLKPNRFDSFTERLPNQLGSSKIGFIQPQLYLANSNLDVISNPEKGYYYTEWTINFKNKALFNQEARAEIRLPQNSVVSKASLWVNGVERQAVFAGKKEVTQAYQKIVNKSRDPLLVNYSGQDRILIQCFPVPANDGEIKIRLGITSSFKNHEKQEIVLPKFIATNFNIEDKTKHNFMLESKTSLASKPIFDLTKDNNVYNLSASLSNA
ncbi:MAG: VIT domain-containing protein, partial [Candidatus Sericytochromatia bacterium]